MAIQVLKGIAYIYQYDLESFLYMLSQMCTHHAQKREFERKLVDRPERNILIKQYTSSFNDIADVKRFYMHIDYFKTILNKFLTAFNYVKLLYRKIWSILFFFSRTEHSSPKLHQIYLKYYIIVSLKRLRMQQKRVKSRGKIVRGD